MSIPAVPIRTPMYDNKGALSRTWVLFFESLGSSSTWTVSGSAIVTIDNVGGVFTPDLSKGTVFRIVLTSNASLGAALNAENKAWTLIIDQDATGGWNLELDPTYFAGVNLLGTAAPLTRAQAQWIAQAGNNSLSGTPSTDLPIPQ